MSDQTRTKIIGLIVIVLLTTVGTVGAAAYNARSTQQIAASASQPNVVGSSPSSQTATTSSTPSTASSSSSATYKDGTYTANGSFYTPDGTEQIGVTLTLASNKITAVSIDSSSIYSGTSAEYTDRFSSGISSVVVGKNIADVQVYRISGASLTPMGFNNALSAIENEAKA
ncbi:MAG: Hep Hag family protein [Candidatus Saccharibacteria bacterium]|nr:Hep Hag family protein [Candidatus Saccharibacteria bacterium]